MSHPLIKLEAQQQETEIEDETDRSSHIEGGSQRRRASRSARIWLSSANSYTDVPSILATDADGIRWSGEFEGTLDSEATLIGRSRHCFPVCATTTLVTLGLAACALALVSGKDIAPSRRTPAITKVVPRAAPQKLHSETSGLAISHFAFAYAGEWCDFATRFDTCDSSGCDKPRYHTQKACENVCAADAQCNFFLWGFMRGSSRCATFEECSRRSVYGDPSLQANVYRKTLIPAQVPSHEAQPEDITVLPLRSGRSCSRDLTDGWLGVGRKTVRECAESILKEAPGACSHELFLFADNTAHANLDCGCVRPNDVVACETGITYENPNVRIYQISRVRGQPRSPQPPPPLFRNTATTTTVKLWKSSRPALAPVTMQATLATTSSTRATTQTTMTAQTFATMTTIATTQPPDWGIALEGDSALAVGLQATNAWVLISHNAGCEENDDNIFRTSGLGDGYTLQSCKSACLEAGDCKAIDFFQESGWCNLFSEACKTPRKTEDSPMSFSLGGESPTMHDAIIACSQLGWRNGWIGLGALICTAPGTPPNLDCNSCDSWRLYVYMDGATDQNPGKSVYKTVAGSFYCGHSPCAEPGFNLPYGGDWYTSACSPKSCANGWSLMSNLPTHCNGAFCTESECCMRLPSCTHGPTCIQGEGWMPKPSFPIHCQSSTCTHDDCCLPANSCGAVLCSPGFMPKANTLPRCLGRPCTQFDCCERGQSTSTTTAVLTTITSTTHSSAHLPAMSHQQGRCVGTLAMNGFQEVHLIKAGMNKAGDKTGDVDVLSTGRLVSHMKARTYFGTACGQSAQYDPQEYAAMQLLGKNLSFQVDLSGAECGTNVAFYLTSLSRNTDNGTCGGDYYCDAAKVCGVDCTEIDMMEANKHVFITTLHTHDDPGGDGDGISVGHSAWSTNEYGPGGICIDTHRPFHVKVSFPLSPLGVSAGLAVALSQPGHETLCPRGLFMTVGAAYKGLAELTQELSLGMTPIISYWGAGENLGWFDGTPTETPSTPSQRALNDDLPAVVPVSETLPPATQFCTAPGNYADSVSIENFLLQ